MVLVTPLLDGSNYHSWSRAVKRAFLFKNKFKFVNGDMPEPSRSDNQYKTRGEKNYEILY